jgi:hypothetical protein
MNDNEFPGGVPAAASTRLLRGIIDQALILSRAPGALEATSGGIAPSRLLGDFIAASLESLYATTGSGVSIETWLASALRVDITLLEVDGPPSLAGMLDATATEPSDEIPAMSELEQSLDAKDALRAIEEFGAIPDDLPRQPRP